MKNEPIPQINIQQSERIAILKAICAIMVVSIHVPICVSEIGRMSFYGQWLAIWHEGITRMAVPCFFLLSGKFVAKYLHKVNKWGGI